VEEIMDRRRFVQLMGGAALSLELATRSRGAARAQATDLAALGLPEITISVTDAGYQVVPASTVAGWTLVTFDNEQGVADNSADIMLLPQGETLDSLIAMLAAMGPEGAPPDWIYQATFAGAPWVPAGTSAQAVVRLTEGEWAIFSLAPLAPAALTVTGGDAPAAAPAALTADLDVEMSEYSFGGLDEPVPAGPQVWKVSSAGEQPHLMTISPVPEGTTQAQLVEGFAAMMSGTPPPDADPTAMATAGGCATLSAGQSLYLALDLAAGTYGAVCFFPDPGSGAPHVMLGMAQVFTAG
jgi:hypothetical protein